MGVHDLWKLLAPCGHRISIETLASSRLAVDISIWIVQFLKAMRDPDGQPMKNAHLIGLLRRILRLLYHGVSPVFVFDGPAPRLKRTTLAQRQRSRQQHGETIKRMAEKILLAQLKMRSVQQLRKKLIQKSKEEGTQNDEDATNSSSQQQQPTKKRRTKKNSNQTKNAPAPTNEDGTSAENAIDIDMIDDSGATSNAAASSIVRSSAAPDDGEEKDSGEPDDSAVPFTEPPPDLSEGDSEDDARHDDDDHFVLPADGQVDPLVLARLPISLQYQVLQQQREHNRFHNFHKFSAVEHNPDAFSEMQMAGFLKLVKFSQRVDSLRKEMNLTVGPGGIPIGPTSSSDSSNLVARDGSKLLIDQGRPQSGSFVYFKSTSETKPFSWRETIKAKKVRDAQIAKKKKAKEEKGIKDDGQAREEEEQAELKWREREALEREEHSASSSLLASLHGTNTDLADWLCTYCTEVNHSDARLPTDASKHVCKTCGMKREVDDDVDDSPAVDVRQSSVVRPSTSVPSGTLSTMPIVARGRRMHGIRVPPPDIKEEWKSPTERYDNHHPKSSPTPKTTTTTDANIKNETTTITTNTNIQRANSASHAHVDDDMPPLEGHTVAHITCPACTFLNPSSSTTCQICETSLVVASSHPAASLSAVPTLAISFEPTASDEPDEVDDLFAAARVNNAATQGTQPNDVTHTRHDTAKGDIIDEQFLEDSEDEEDPSPQRRPPTALHASSTTSASTNAITRSESQDIRLATERSLQDLSARASMQRASGISFGPMTSASIPTHAASSAHPSSVDLGDLPTSVADGDAGDDDVDWVEDDDVIPIDKPIATSTRDESDSAPMEIDQDEEVTKRIPIKLEHQPHSRAAQVPTSSSPGATHVDPTPMRVASPKDNPQSSDSAVASTAPATQTVEPQPPTILQTITLTTNTSTPTPTPADTHQPQQTLQCDKPDTPTDQPKPSISSHFPPSTLAHPHTSPFFPSSPGHVAISGPIPPAPSSPAPSPPVESSDPDSEDVLIHARPDDDAETRAERHELQRLLGEIDQIGQEIQETNDMNPIDIDEAADGDDDPIDVTPIVSTAAPAGGAASSEPSSSTLDGLILPRGVTFIRPQNPATIKNRSHQAFLDSQARNRQIAVEDEKQRQEDEDRAAMAALLPPDAAPLPSASLVDDAPMVYDAFPSHLSASEAVALAQSFDSSYLESASASKQQANAMRGEAHVTEDMIEDCKKLLQLFGIPYIESPGEAEAQCAMLESLGLVDGIITDDSDVFLFGAQRVYRHFFESKKFCEKYTMDEITQKLGMDRRKLIHSALLLGSDYTPGVKGIGIVNATEILNAFPGEHGLEELRDWIWSIESDCEPNLPEYPLEGCSLEERSKLDAEYRLANFKYQHRNLKRSWTISRDSFPNPDVIDAYWHPNVDTRTSELSWSQPNWSELATFCRNNLEWSESEVSAQLTPVQQAMDLARQTSLDKFFDPNDSFAVIASERLNRAVRGLVSQTLTEEEIRYQQQAQSRKEAQATKRKVATEERKKRKKAASKDVKATTTAARTSIPLLDDDDDDDFELTAEDEAMLHAIETNATTTTTPAPAVAATSTKPSTIQNETREPTKKRKAKEFKATTAQAQA